MWWTRCGFNDSAARLREKRAGAYPLLDHEESSHHNKKGQNMANGWVISEPPQRFIISLVYPVLVVGMIVQWDAYPHYPPLPDFRVEVGRGLSRNRAFGSFLSGNHRLSSSDRFRSIWRPTSSDAWMVCTPLSAPQKGRGCRCRNLSARFVMPIERQVRWLGRS